MKKRVTSFLLCCIFVVLSTLSCFAVDVKNEKVYKPLDLVVVVDSSGSMLDSDSKRTAPSAVRMLVNMMPAADSRVGVISFNKQPTVLTTDAGGQAALIGLNDFVGVETIRNDVSSIQYSGGTGIGNAVYAATELLKNNSNDERAKAIILFTDGVNDFGSNQFALSECEQNEVSAIKWAKDNGCYIYCVGYDYITANGVSSMGTNGEGLLKLQNIADTTGGKCKAINNISEIEQLLIEFLADVCDLNYKTIATIPGDGGHHSCEISVSPSVIEADIRIAGGGEDSIANGKIHLYDPSGKEIELKNSGNVRFDTDATAASIKVMMPKTGKWILTVDDIKGDDIHVGLLEHFKMNITSQLELPDGNPEGVAYTNDIVGIKTWLTYDGNALEDDAIYDAVTSATAVCVSRVNPDEKKTITLTRDGRSFIGSFTIPEDCFYDITIRLDWDTVYREDTLTIASSNKPVTLVKDIDNVVVNKKKSVAVSDIFQYVSDDENDDITATISSISSPDVIDATIDGDTLTITGKKWSSTLITVAYKDAQGNTVESTFEVKVNDPVAMSIIIGCIVLLVITLIILAALLKKASNRVSGCMRIISIADGFIDASGNYKSTRLIYDNPNIDHDVDLVENFHQAEEGDFGNPFGTDFSAFETNNGDAFAPTAEEPLFNDFGFGDSFETPFESTGFETNTEPEPQWEPTGADTGANGFDLLGSSDAAGLTDFSSFSELERSNKFDEKISIGGSRVRKTDLNKVLVKFIAYYDDFMCAQNEDSVLSRTLKAYIEQHFSSVFSRIHLLGTLYGQSGVVLKVEKNLLQKTVKVHEPKMVKDKVQMNPAKRKIKLSLSVICGEKDRDGNTPCSHIEIEYSKKY